MRSAAIAAGWAWAAAIVWLSLTPSPPQADFSHSDKLGHFAAYGLLMFWFARLYKNRIAFAAGFIAMGIALEFAQGALGYRTSEVFDMLANTIGVFMGWTAALILSRREN
jgi:VanZ family protein